jgi:hypothetical protein
MDLVANHTAKDSHLVIENPDRYLRGKGGEVCSPYAVDPDDPEDVTTCGDLAELDYTEQPERTEVLACWDELVAHSVRLGFRRSLDVVETRPEDWEKPALDIRAFVAAVNRMKAETTVLNEEGPQKRFTAPDAPQVGLVRRSENESVRVAALINPYPQHGRYFACAKLASAVNADLSAMRESTPLHGGASAADHRLLRLGSRSLRIFRSD